MRIHCKRRWLLPAALVLAVGSASAQGYPVKPVRLIVPYGPGGGTDVAARITSHFLGERLGVQVVVENRVGGSGAVGLEAAARAAPDGYTLLFSGPDAISTLPLLRKNLSVDPFKDFVPIAQVGTADFVFAVHPKVPAHTIEELIALAKSKPGALRYSSAGAGTTLHVMGEMLKYRTGIDLVHVPYKSGGQAAIDTIAGHVEMISTAVSVIIKQIQADQLRPLAVSSAERSNLLPAVPTMAERGFPTFIATSWFGVFGPKGLSEPVIKHLSEEIKVAASSDEFRKRAEAIGIGGKVVLREEFAKYIATEFGRWREVIEAAKIKVDEQ
ncbi:MAG: Bug family tripartite tricarboxylate transporter substrate binding protein [Burkholderiales bacterium]